MKALIAEDELRLANNIKIFLQHEEFDGKRFELIHTAENGAVALDFISKNNYDVVILDLKMPQADGTQVIEALNSLEPVKKRPIVILITAYAGSFEKTTRLTIKMGVQAVLKKPVELPHLMEALRELIKLRRQLFDSQKHGERPQCQWTLALGEMGAAFIQVKGLLNFFDTCQVPWLRQASFVLEQEAQMAGALMTTPPVHRYWKFAAKRTGADLFEKLFVGKIQDSLRAASRTVLHTHPHDLKLTFAGPRDCLQLPFEFLNDGTDFLVLRYPMRRFVSGIQSMGQTNIFDLLSELRSRQEKLRILLVASNTVPAIDAVDEEVEMLYKRLRKELSPDDFLIDYIPTEKATLETVISRLKGCPYHILHYAGHGYHTQDNPDKSSLFFWEKPRRKGGVLPLTVDKLKNTLRQDGSHLCFVYLSCCAGTASAGEGVLLDNDFLGIADSLIQAGVPSVLGFRWPVSDQGARELAYSFYKSLFEQGDYSTALFTARCEVRGNEVSNIGDWLSPILIVQGWK